MKKRTSKLLLILLAFVMIFTACNNNQTAEETKEETVEETAVSEEKPEEKEPEVEKEEEKEPEEEGEIDPITGLKIVEEVPLGYAEAFTITKLEGDCTLLSSKYDHQSDIFEYLLMTPEDSDIEIDNDEVVVLRGPVKSMLCTSSTDLAFLSAIDRVDVAKLATTDEWYIDGPKEAMENGELIFVGKSKEIDFEVVEEEDPELSTISMGRGETSEKVEAKLDEMGKKHICISNHIEDDPRGRMEWVKFFGVLTGDEEKAVEFFDNQNNMIEEIAKQERSEDEKLKAAYFSISSSNGSYRIRKAGDYGAKTFELADAIHPFPDIGVGETGSQKLSGEDFLVLAKDVDVLISQSSGYRFGSLDELLEGNEYLTALKAYKNGNIWTIKDNYWQTLDRSGEQISEINRIIYDPDVEDELVYFRRLK